MKQFLDMSQSWSRLKGMLIKKMTHHILYCFNGGQKTAKNVTEFSRLHNEIIKRWKRCKTNLFLQ